MKLTSSISLNRIKKRHSGSGVTGPLLKAWYGFIHFVLWPVSVLTGYLARLPVEDREYFYTMLGESIASKITFVSIFDQIEADSSHAKLRLLARVARRGLIEQQGDFTTYLPDSRLLPALDVTLLKIGVQRQSLPDICGYLIEQNIESISFDRHFWRQGKQWILAVPLSMVILVYFGDVLDKMRHASGDQTHLFFRVYDWTVVYWPVVAILTVWLILSHRLAQPNLRRYRHLAHRLSIFKFYDMEWELKITRLCAVLIPSGLTNMALLEQLGRVARPNRQLYMRVVRAQRSSSEQAIMDLLPFFLSPRTIAKVKAKAPNLTPKEIGAGFVFASKINYLRLEKEIKTTSNFLILILLMITMIFIGPLVAISSGL